VAKFKLEDGSEVEAFTEAELKERIDNELAGLKAKRDELLGLHAKDKERLQELESQQKQIEEDRQREKGEFKELYEKTKAELDAEKEAARKFRQTIQQKDLEGSAGSIASSLASKDAKRAELLKKEIMQYANYTDEGIKYEIGGVEIDEEKLRQKIVEDYPFLVDGSNASGGGAQGGSRNGQAGKKFNEMTGAELKAIKDEDPAAYDRLKREYYGN